MVLSAEQAKAGSRQIRQWLENDKRVVTFRDLSRSVGCHVDLAKNLLATYQSSNSDVHATYLLTGPLLATSTLAQTQLTAERLKAQEDEKSLARLSATQKIKIVELDQVSDGERNSEDGDLDDEGVDEILGNDRGDEGGISGNGDRRTKLEEEQVVQPEKTPRWGVVMVGEEHLEEKKALFQAESLSIHIYALAPAPVRDPGQYLAHLPDLRAHKAYHNPAVYGTITGQLQSASTGKVGKTLKDGAMDFGAGSSKKEEKPPAKLGLASASKVNAKTAESGTASKVVPKVEKPAEKATPSTAAKSGAGAATTSKAQAPAQAQARSVSSRSKRRVMSDDEADGPEGDPKTDTAEPEPSPKNKKEQTSSMVRADDQAAMEAMMGMDMDMDEDMDDELNEPGPSKKGGSSKQITSGSASGSAGVGAGTGAGGQPPRKRRKIKKSKTEVNEKGYMVTTDYTSEESYSGESDTETGLSKGKAGTKARKSVGTTSAAADASRASSMTSTGAGGDSEDRKPSAKALAAAGSMSKGSSASIGSNSAGGAGAASTKAKPLPKPAANKPKGQGTLAGFFKKK